MLVGAPKAPRLRPYLLARVCTLAPDSVEDADLPSQVSAQELKQFETAFWSLTVRGALSYRAKRYQEAVPLLQRSITAESKDGAAVLNWLWLAMAYHQLGEKDQARCWLDKAEKWLDSLGSEMPANANALKLHRHNWLEAHILRREAKMLLSSPPEK
jgi:Flp pilus assembly protein TadD